MGQKTKVVLSDEFVKNLKPFIGARIEKKYKTMDYGCLTDREEYDVLVNRLAVFFNDFEEKIYKEEVYYGG